MEKKHAMKPVGRLIQWAQELLLVPGQIHKWIMFAGIHLVFSPLLSTILAPSLLRSAKEEVQHRGMKPEVVDMLAPHRDVFFRDSSVASLTHLAVSAPNLLMLGYMMPAGGYVPGVIGGFSTKDHDMLFGTAENICIITVGKGAAGMDPREVASQATGIPLQDMRRDFNVSAKAVADWVFLHELAHCGEVQDRRHALKNEEDSDYKALSYLSSPEYAVQHGVDPSSMAAFVFNLRAARTSTEEHDIALVLEAHLRGITPPDLGDVMEANHLAYDFLHGKITQERLNALALHRVQLYHQAREYFTGKNAAAVPVARPAL